jgi:putative hydrolase of the HAD superfamily
VYIPHSNLPEHEIGHTAGEPDAVIHSLADLLPLIDSWNMRHDPREQPGLRSDC